MFGFCICLFKLSSITLSCVITVLQEAGHIKNIVVLIFRHIQSLHLMNSEVACVLVSSGSQVQPQQILDPDYLPDYLFVSYDYALSLFFIEPAAIAVLFFAIV